MTFPIDVIPDVFSSELSFLNNLKEKTVNTSTILYSRIHNVEKEYDPVSIEEFMDQFSGVGHSLSILVEKSYVIPLILDIDCCTCKKNNKREDHGTFNHMSTIIKGINTFLKRKFGDDWEKANKEHKFKLSVMQNVCSCHIYGNFSLALPLYCDLVQYLGTLSFNGALIKIDTPTHLPLPFSSKDGINVYKQAPKFYTNLRLGSTLFFDNVLYTKDDYSKCESCPFADYKLQDDRTYYMSWTNVILRSNHIMNNDVRSYNINTSSTYIKEALTAYFEHHKIKKSEKVMDENENNEEDEGIFGYETMDVDPSFGEDVDTSLGFLPTKDYPKTENENLEKFMLEFNLIMGSGDWENNGTTQLFLYYAEQFGWCYLQHLTVMVHKYMLSVDPNIEFKSYRDELFKLPIENDNKTVLHFINNVSMSIITAYPFSWRVMLNHYKYLNILNYSPDMPLPDLIKAAFIKEVEPYTINNISNWGKNNPKALEPILQSALKNVINKLHLFIKSSTSANSMLWFNSNGTFSQLKTKSGSVKDSIISFFASLGSEFSLKLNTRNMVADYCSGYLTQLTEKYTVDGSEFLYPTNYGIFNSQTGLYSAHTSLAPMTMLRCYGIMSPDTYSKIPSGWFNQINSHCIQLQILSKEISKLINSTGVIYSKFIVMPALIQLRYISMISESDIAEFFSLTSDAQVCFGEHLKDITEYYPFSMECCRRFLPIMNLPIGSFPQMVMVALSADRINTKEKWDQFINRNAPVIEFKPYDEEKTHLENLLDNFDLSKDEIIKMTILMIFYNKVGGEYIPLNESVGIKTLPKFLETCHSMTHTPLSTPTNRETMKNNFTSTIESIFGGDNTDTITKVCVQECIDIILRVGMTANFNHTCMMQIFEHAASMFVSKNIMKKAVIYFGSGDTGKSYIADIFSQMLAPSAARIMDLKSANQRSGLSSNSYIVILNEVKTMDSTFLKSVTGNDAVMTQEFYSQNQHLKSFQSLIMGCTNEYIKFTDGADKTTVDRLHVIHVTGRQIKETMSQRSLFDAMIAKCYYQNMINRSTESLACSMSIVGYGIYKQKRDFNGYIVYDTNSPAEIKYREEVYGKNNRIYRYLKNCNIIYIENFEMESKTLKDILKQNFEVYGTSYKSVADIHHEIKATYGIDLENGIIKNFQDGDIIKHTKELCEVEECPGATISMDDLLKRINCTKNFKDKIHSRNAIGYFSRKYAKYYEGELFKNIKFVENDSLLDVNIPDNVSDDGEESY